MSGFPRHRLSVASIAAVVLCGCAQAPKSLYMWDNFPRQQYEALLQPDMSPDSQIQQLEAMAVKGRGAGASLPPGFRAHLGMLYLNSGNAERARQLWTTEMEAFPESAAYMIELLKRLDGGATAAKSGSPA